MFWNKRICKNICDIFARVFVKDVLPNHIWKNWIFKKISVLPRLRAEAPTTRSTTNTRTSGRPFINKHDRGHIGTEPLSVLLICSKEGCYILNQDWGAGAGAAWKKNQEPQPEPLGKKIRSRSRLKKKSGAGAGKKFAGSPALVLWNGRYHKKLLT